MAHCTAMRLPRLLLTVFVVSATLGCGSVPSSTSCKVTVTGAANFTSNCTVILVSDGSKTAVTIVSSVVNPPFSVGIDLPANLLPQEYKDADAQFSQVVYLGTGTSVWNQSKGHTDPANFPDKGSFDLQLSSVGDKVASGSNTNYAHAKGTLTATLPADTKTGASGTVNAVVTFTDSIGAAGSGSGGGTGGTGGGSGGGSGGGAGGGGGGGGGSGEGTCSMAFTGGVAQTFTCDPFMSKVGDNKTGLVINKTPSDHLAGSSVNVVIAGPPSAGTFTAAAPVESTSSYVLINEMNQWNQGFSSSSTIGSFTLTFSNPGTLDAMGLRYVGMHGTYTASMVPVASSAAATQLTVTF